MLGHMVELLEGFHVDLNKISAEIRDLQERSNDMNLRLRNRMSSQDLLSKVLDGLICEGEVNEFFLSHLLDLNKKMTYVKKQKGAHIRALKDVGPELERLRLKSSEKIREFLLKRIESLKTPNTNISIIQQNQLLKYKELYWFLLDRYSEAAGEVRAVYITTVQQYYLASFEKYVRSLSSVQTVIADKGDLIGSAEAQGSGVGAAASRFTLGLFSAKNQLKDRSNVYSLGERVQVLTTEDAGIILPHIAEEQRLKFPYEVIFKSFNRLLMDNASSDSFRLQWKKQKASGSPNKSVPTSSTAGSPSVDQSTPTIISPAMDPNFVFAEIFEPTLKFIQGALRQYIDNSYDAVGVLLCIRLNTFHLRMMQKRRIPCLENYMNLLNILLWPRFQAIIDLHIESLRKIGKVSVTKDCHPHFITRRYAEFAASVLALNDGFDDALLLNSLIRLRNEVESLLFRMSEEVPDRTDKLILWINNHDLVHSILGEYNMPCFDEEKQYFANSLESKTGEYVEEELKKKAGFGFLMEFVDRAELEKNLDTLDTGRFESVASQFNNSWKQGITDLNASILQSFPNFQNGARILHAGFTLLLLFYKRFLNLFEKRFVGKGRKVHPVGLQAVLFEIKKNQPNF
ncbi:Sac2 family-domain-containing protein [Obelidium mucronatum]|nr:Sac2 family-domain-containing protein [Obelidium mucronatum]